MSLNQFVEYSIGKSAEPQETQFVQTNVKWQSISDNMQFNYSSGFLSFSGNSIVNSSPDQLHMISQGHLIIPFGVTVTAAASAGTASFGSFASLNFSHAAENAFAIGLKSAIAILDSVQITLGSQLNQSSQYTNLYITERLKSMSSEQQKKALEDILFVVDGMDSYSYSSDLLESNNRTVNANPNTLIGGNGFGSKRNEAHIQRMRHSNRDHYDTTARAMFSSTETSVFRTGGLVSIVNSNNVALTPGSTATSPLSSLVFQYVMRIPLAWVHPFFESCPDLSSLSNFQMTIGTNLAASNSWVCNYAAATAGNEMALTSIQSNQSVGMHCPFMLSQVYNQGSVGSGCRVVMSDATASLSLTVRPWIGFAADTVGSVTLTNGRPRVGTYPCLLQWPVAMLTAPYLSQVMSIPKKVLKWNDFIVNNTYTNVSVNASVNHIWQVPAAKLRRLFICPYLSAVGKANTVSPLLSPVSSAGITCSPAKLRDLQIFLSGSAVFLDHTVTFADEHFYNNRYILEGQSNCNAITSYFQSGTTSFRDFQVGGASYVIDLCRASDSTVDSLARSLQIQFRIDAAQGFANTYDILYIVEYECNGVIDLRTSENVKL